MIAPSRRHAPLLLGLVALLLVPVLRSRFEEQREDDCARPDVLAQLRRVPGTGTMAERWEKYGPDVPQWVEAELLGNDEHVKLRAALIRSFKASDLYTRPPHVLLGKLEAGERLVEQVEVDGATLPIQTLYDTSSGREAMASYLFVYGNQPVERPVLAQLASAPAQAWSGRRPLSLLIVAGPVPTDRRPQARERAQRWLVSAWRFHRDACRP